MKLDETLAHSLRKAVMESAPEGDWQPLTDPLDPRELQIAVSVTAQLAAAGFAIVPKEPTPDMWGELARDIVMWDRFPVHTGAGLHRHLKSIGRTIPDWLVKEIPPTDQTPPKGTVAACIYKAMLEASFQF